MSRKVYVVVAHLSWGATSRTSWPTLDLAYRAVAGLHAQGYLTSLEQQEVSL